MNFHTAPVFYGQYSAEEKGIFLESFFLRKKEFTKTDFFMNKALIYLLGIVLSGPIKKSKRRRKAMYRELCEKYSYG